MWDDEAVRLLHSMVRIPSVSGEESLLARFLVGELQHAGLDARIDEVGNVIAEWGEEGPHLLLLGRLDTLPGRPPVRLAEGVLHGRGASAGKAPLAAFVVAAARHARAGSPMPMRLTLAACVGSRAPGRRGARHLADTLLAPDLLLAGEPTGMDGIGVGHPGSLRSELIVDGREPREEEADQTVSARACALWERVRSAAEDWSRGRDEDGERLRAVLLAMRTEDDGLEERANLSLTLRLPQDLGPERAEAWLRSVSGPSEVRVLGGLPAWSAAPSSPLREALSEAIREVDGEPRPLGHVEPSDLSVLAPVWGCDALAYGPGDARIARRRDDRIELAEYLRAVRVLEALLPRLARVHAGRPSAETSSRRG